MNAAMPIALVALALGTVPDAEAASAGTVPNSETNGLVKFGKKMVTREYAREAIRKAKLKQTGGIVRKPGSARGWFVLLDAQSIVPADGYAGALAAIERQVKTQTKCARADRIDIATLKDEIAKAGGSIGVALVEDGTTPALLGAPEEGWGLVNVARLKGATEDATAARTRREILRAFGLAAGAMYAAQGDFVLQPVRRPEDLDRLKREEFGAMMLHIFPLSLPYYGVAPWRQTTYRNACQEGWAPPPTNDVQKAIWDKVHALPTEPIKIRPEESPVDAKRHSKQ